MTLADHSIQPPDVVEPGRRAWITRGANFVIEISQAEAGATLSRIDQPDEYMVLLPDAPVQLQAGDRVLSVDPDSLLIVPPGESTLTMKRAGLVMRVFSSHAQDVLAMASNQQPYENARPDVAPLRTWPVPKGGFGPRCY